jgi:superfamily II DNA or RNA helicase
MILIKIDNSECQITGLTVQQHKSLKEVLSYTLNAQASYFSGYGPKKQSLLGKTGIFPSGLLSKVKAWLKGQAVEYKVVSLNTRPKASPGLHKLRMQVTPYPEQTAIVEACFRSSKGIVSAATGFGKSLTMMLLIQKMQMRTLIIVPNLSLKQQLTETVVNYFGAGSNITVANIDSRTLIKETDYDMLIVDESHHSAAKTYRTLNKKAWNKIYHRFFFTATPYRAMEEEQILFESICGEIIYEVDYQTAMVNGYILPVDAFTLEVPKQKTSAMTWPQVYSQLVVNNEVRNQRIASLLTSLHANGFSTLCLVKEIQHGKNILALAPDAFFANGQDEDTPHLMRMFAEGRLKTLIGTTGICGEGVDSRAAEYIVIAGLGKSKPQFLQQVGRGVRRFPGKESCKVILILDKSHKWTREHWKAQVKYLKEIYNTDPILLDL